MALTLFDGFEDGDVSEWTVNTSWSATTSRAYNGSHSGFEDLSSTTYLIAERSFNTEITTFELYWQETSGSYGGGYNLTNSSGNRVFSFGTGNPSWIYTSGSSGFLLYSGDGYGRWIRSTVTLDDSNNDVTLEMEDLSSGALKSTTANYDNSGPVTGMEIVNISTPDDLANKTDTSSGSYEMWTDDIQIESGFNIYIDGSQVKEVTIDGTAVQNITIDGTSL